MKNFTLILKTVERCNLNCSYCYFFNGSDRTYLQRPKFIDRDTIDALVNFIRDGIKVLGIDSLSVILHGGEPLMQPKEDFVYLLEKFQGVFSEINLSFAMQTNATLVTNKWIDLLKKYNVGVGVSIDGPPDYHNRYRVDHRGNGSYEYVLRGIELLREGLDSKLGCLAVVTQK